MSTNIDITRTASAPLERGDSRAIINRVSHDIRLTVAAVLE